MKPQIVTHQPEAEWPDVMGATKDGPRTVPEMRAALDAPPAHEEPRHEAQAEAPMPPQALPMCACWSSPTHGYDPNNLSGEVNQSGSSQGGSLPNTTNKAGTTPPAQELDNISPSYEPYYGARKDTAEFAAKRRARREP